MRRVNLYLAVRSAWAEVIAGMKVMLAGVATAQRTDRRAINALACATRQRCLAVDASGNAIVATNFGAARPRWRVTAVVSGRQLLAGSCPGSDLCVVVSGSGVLLSHDPFSADPLWTRQPTGGAGIGVSCPTTRLCVVLDGRGALATSTDPGAARPRWTVHRLRGLSLTTGVITCTAKARCLLGTLEGSLALVGDAERSRSARDLSFYENATFDAVACATSSRCISPIEDGATETTTDPRLTRWRRRNPDFGGYSFTGAACPSANACVLTAGGLELSSTRAFARRAAWRQAEMGAAGGSGVSCPSVSICLTFGPRGRIGRSLRPFARSPRWASVRP